MAERGLGNSADNPRLAERAALMTRAAKKRDIDRGELRDVWRKQAAGLGLDARALVSGGGREIRLAGAGSGPGGTGKRAGQGPGFGGSGARRYRRARNRAPEPLPRRCGNHREIGKARQR